MLSTYVQHFHFLEDYGEKKGKNLFVVVPENLAKIIITDDKNTIFNSRFFGGIKDFEGKKLSIIEMKLSQNILYWINSEVSDLDLKLKKKKRKNRCNFTFTVATTD